MSLKEDYARGVNAIYIGPDPRTPPGERRTAVLIDCGSCRNIGVRTLTSTKPFDPEGSIKHFRRDGWRTDGRNPSKNRCPVCTGEQSPRAALQEVSRVKTPEKSMTIAGESQPLLGVEDRARIRFELDKAYDDKTGTYLDGQTDQLIGGRLGLPWRVVAEFRELAYGPLRADPQVDEAGKQLEALADEVRALKAEATGLTGRLLRVEENALRLARVVAEVQKRFKS